MNSNHPVNREFSFGIRVKTKASSEGISGKIGNRFKIAVNEAPEKGKANKSICGLLAGLFNVPKSAVEIIAGEFSRDKTIRITGVSETEGIRRLTEEISLRN